MAIVTEMGASDGFSRHALHFPEVRSVHPAWNFTPNQFRLLNCHPALGGKLHYDDSMALARLSRNAEIVRSISHRNAPRKQTAFKLRGCEEDARSSMARKNVANRECHISSRRIVPDSLPRKEKSQQRSDARSGGDCRLPQ